MKKDRNVVETIPQMVQTVAQNQKLGSDIQLTPIEKRTQAVRYMASIGAKQKGIGTLDFSNVDHNEYEEDEIAQLATGYLMSEWSFSIEN